MNALPTVAIPASRSLFLSERTALLPQERMPWFRQERSLAPVPVRLRLLAARKFKS